MLATLTADVCARFWAKVLKVDDKDSCWIWTAATFPRGYGKFSLPDGYLEGAHRVGWVLQNERDIPVGLLVLHRCDNRPCVRGAHLFLGTHADNMRDAARKGRVGGVRIPPRFTREDAIELQRLHASGLSHRVLGERFGVDKRTIGRTIARTVVAPAADADAADPALRSEVEL